MENVRPERTGWRDEKLSRRHRDWGVNCPAIDIDFLLIEYDCGKAVAIIDYKHEKAEFNVIKGKTHPSFRAFADLADRARIPAFVVRYADDLSWYQPYALNAIAEKWLPEPTILSELNWLRFLYALRGYIVPDYLMRQLSSTDDFESLPLTG